MSLRLPAVLRPVVRLVSGEAERLGASAWAVGGCVRDWRLGRPTKDLDVVLETDPEPLARACAGRLGATVEAFDRFGTIRVLGKGGLRLDFARARAETYAAPAALPEVRPATLREELVRRDFSVNAMAAPLAGDGLGDILDPIGGLADLDRGVLRVLHAASFRDDPTRLFRAARFSARFGFTLEPETEALRRAAAELPSLLSRERLRGELWRFLEEAKPAAALAKARAWGLDAWWHPRFKWPESVDRAKDPLERLALIALEMGPKSGGELLRSLHLERAQTQLIQTVLDVSSRKASPRAALAGPALAALARHLGRKPAAFKPLLGSGEDLRTRGAAPGPKFSELLDRAARAQWAGKFSTRAAALRWLRAELA
ncbi:MAG: CCA tRNA nucleotidyltransferase [Elusimicrobia bacterium]|nr:CCA tRNA nucleotidyltransferase [Elusimicrobiota bacterium]